MNTTTVNIIKQGFDVCSYTAGHRKPSFRRRSLCRHTVQSMNKFNRPHLKQHNGFLCHKRNKFKCV